MGFMSKIANSVATMAMGDQAVLDPQNLAYATQRNWTYTHSELLAGKELVETKGFSAMLREMSKETESDKGAPTGGFDIDNYSSEEPLVRTQTYPFDRLGGVSGREIYTGSHNERPFSAGTVYWKKKVEDGPDTEYRMGIISLGVSPHLKLPSIQLFPETKGSRLLGGVFGDVDVESHDFNQAWNISTREENRNTTITLLHPQMQEYLLQLVSSGISVSFYGSRVVIATKKYRIKESGFNLSDGGLSVGTSSLELDSSAKVVDDYMLSGPDIEQWLPVAEHLGLLVPTILYNSHP